MLLVIALFVNLVFFLFKFLSRDYVSSHFVAIFHPVTLSLVTGFILRQLFRAKYSAYQPQAEVISSHFLTWALILLGAQLSFSELSLLSSGLVSSLLLVLFLVASFTLILARLMRVPLSPAVWVLFGNCICGPTAISFSYQFFHGDKGKLAKVIGINTFVGLVLMLLLPIVGEVVQCNSEQFGIWVGSSLQSTAQVVTSASLFSETSADIALVLKSLRILLMLPMVILLLSIVRQSYVDRSQINSPSFSLRSLTQLVPTFMIGFLLNALIFNIYDLFAEYLQWSGWTFRLISWFRMVMAGISSYCLSVSMLGIGFLCSFSLESSDYRLLLLSCSSAMFLVLSAFVMCNFVI